MGMIEREFEDMENNGSLEDDLEAASVFYDSLMDDKAEVQIASRVLKDTELPIRLLVEKYKDDEEGFRQVIGESRRRSD